jgi:hypothetical protein
MDPFERESDFDFPPKGSDLSRWRIFIMRVMGDESEAFVYLDLLCKQFGPDYTIDLDPNIFMEHVAWVAFSMSRRMM